VQEQSHLLTQMSDWARKLAEDPLTGDISLHQEPPQTTTTMMTTTRTATAESPSIETQCSI
jgi:hypothetical protein